MFIKHFPVVAEASKILYSKKFQPSKIMKASKKVEAYKAPKKDEDSDIRGTVSVIRKKDKNYPEEKELLERRKDEIDFLRDNSEEFLEVGEILDTRSKLMLSYNLMKYYLVLLREFKEGLNKDFLPQRYPGKKWVEYLATKQFKELWGEVNDDLSQYEIKFNNLHNQCEAYIKEIDEINPKFKTAFTEEIHEKGFEGPFKESYRKSTIYVFGVLREVLKNKANRKGNKLNYTLSMLVISHAFNNIFSDFENLGVIFKEYFEEKKKPVEKIDFSELREWMGKSKEGVLNAIAKSIIKIYFTA